MKAMKHNIMPLITALAAAGGLVSSPVKAQSTFDVYFLSDTTGSMGSLIDGVQTSSNSIVDSFLMQGNVLFGVGEYKDGNADAFGFRHNLTDMGLPILSGDTAAVETAIDLWNPSGGGNFPEDNLYGLREVASSVPWRDGSRRIVFWFGDAPGLDPASDGTTLDATLAALNENCIEVIALDLGSLDSTGQATAITEQMLDCGGEGGLIEELDLSGLTDEEIANLIEEVLSELFIAVTGGGDIPATAGIRAASISMVRTHTQDIARRLARMRAGIPAGMHQAAPAPAADPKGGMPKGAVVAGPATMKQWEIYGGLYYYDQSGDPANGLVGTAIRPVLPDYDLEIWGGHAGVEYRFNENWAVGGAVSASNADLDMTRVGRADIDGIALIPYVSYVQRDVFPSADLYLDLLYAHTWLEYDITRATGGIGSPDGDSDTLEFNAGLNFKAANVVHGPYASLRWIDGDIDAYREFNTGVQRPGTDFESIATNLGYQASFPIAMAGGTLVPHVRAAWEHEFEDDFSAVGGIPISGAVDEDLLVAGAGIGWYADTGWFIGLDYEGRFGSDTTGNYVGVIGGFEF